MGRGEIRRGGPARAPVARRCFSPRGPAPATRPAVTHGRARARAGRAFPAAAGSRPKRKDGEAVFWPATEVGVGAKPTRGARESRSPVVPYSGRGVMARGGTSDRGTSRSALLSGPGEGRRRGQGLTRVDALGAGAAAAVEPSRRGTSSGPFRRPQFGCCQGRRTVTDAALPVAAAAAALGESPGWSSVREAEQRPLLRSLFRRGPRRCPRWQPGLFRPLSAGVGPLLGDSRRAQDVGRRWLRGNPPAPASRAEASTRLGSGRTVPGFVFPECLWHPFSPSPSSSCSVPGSCLIRRAVQSLVLSGLKPSTVVKASEPLRGAPSTR